MTGTPMIETSSWPGSPVRMLQQVPCSTYRLRGEFREARPVGAFTDGIRFLSRCMATIVSELPGCLESQDGWVSLEVNGLVFPSEGSPMPLPAVMAAPGFEFPDLDFRLTGSAFIRSIEAGHVDLDGSVVAIEGWVNFESGELEVEARPL